MTMDMLVAMGRDPSVGVVDQHGGHGMVRADSLAAQNGTRIHPSSGAESGKALFGVCEYGEAVGARAAKVVGVLVPRTKIGYNDLRSLLEA